MTREQARNHIANTCGHGWLPLVDRVFDALPHGAVVVQAYQKWAGLDFEIRPEPDGRLLALLEEVREMSRSTCEECGKSASEWIDDGWLVSLCDGHARSRKCIDPTGRPA